MIAHTPGPWMAADHAANGRLPIVSQANGRSVGAVSWFGAMPEGFTSHEDECHANARLIAAAPDLLAALKALRAAAYELPNDWSEEMLGAFRAANKAIDRAEGIS